jgi:hypothetical protein
MTMVNPYRSPEHDVVEAAHAREEISASVIGALVDTRPWATLISIVSFLGSAFSVLLALLVLASYETEPDDADIELAILVVFESALAVYAVFAAVLAALVARYSSRIGRAERTREQAEVVAALDAQRLCFRWLGVMLLVGLVGAGLALTGLMVAAFAGVLE